MKHRCGFVSNSSSSSFVVSKLSLTDSQIEAIKNHEKSGLPNADSDRWNIDESEYVLSGSTFMDNFDMSEFMELIGVDMTKVKWDY